MASSSAKPIEYHPPTSPYHPSRSRFPFPPLPLSSPIPQSHLAFPAGYASGSFVQGASTIAFHIPSKRVALVHDTRSGWWFLPKGRKDAGEEIGVAAVREGEEESGFKSHLHPHTAHTKQPPLQHSPSTPHTEPFYLHLSPIYQTPHLVQHLIPENQPKPNLPPPTLYLLFYFISAIEGEEKVENWTVGVVGGGHEVGYESFLFGVGEAVEKLSLGRLVYCEEDETVRVAGSLGSGEWKGEGGDGGEDEWVDEEHSTGAAPGITSAEGYNGLKAGEIVTLQDVPACDNRALEAVLIVEAWKALAVDGKPKHTSKAPTETGKGVTAWTEY